MTDVVDRANADYELWLQGQISKSQQLANDVTNCVDCGEPIGIRRKQALPHAMRCIECQKLLESQR